MTTTTTTTTLQPQVQDIVLQAKFLGLQGDYRTFSSSKGMLRLHHTSTDGILEKVSDKAQLYYTFSYLLSVAYQGMVREVTVI